MDVFDLVLFPLYLALIYIGAFWLKMTRRKDENLQRYFIPALSLKLVGGTIFGCIYFFYYFDRGGADTVYYFYESMHITDILLERPMVGIKLMFIKNGTFDLDILPYMHKLIFYRDPPTFFVAKTAAIINLFTFKSYLVTTFFFAILGLSGCWALFVTLNEIYPKMHKNNAIATLFLPSIFFWGSGMLKDTLTLSAVGWFVYAIYQLIFKKQRTFWNVFVLLLSFYCIYIVKIYIIICLIPGVMVWIVLKFNSNIRNPKFRAFLKPFLFAIGVLIGLVGIAKISESDERYNLDTIAKTSVTTAEYIRATSEGGSSYYLGEMDASFTGLLKLFLPAVNVSLFRPYLWEIRNFFMIFSSLESFYFLILTIYAIFKNKLKDIYKLIVGDPFIVFCLIFSIIFAFSVGVSTNNFGSLVRYKLPLLPFYYVFISTILQESKNARERRDRDLPQKELNA